MTQQIVDGLFARINLPSQLGDLGRVKILLDDQGVNLSDGSALG